MTKAFNPAKALDVLSKHGVRYVLIGGLGARVRGSPTLTNDLDICYARDEENIERLVGALKELHARLRGAPKGVKFRLEPATFLQQHTFTFATDAGGLDCIAAPAGTAGYDDLKANAEALELGAASVLVASVEDLIRMKLAAGRPKDLIEAEVLGALQDELDAE